MSLVADHAVLSADKRYRYALSRGVAQTGPVYLFIGVNPSTADASIDDATIRKLRGFVTSWGGRGFHVGNAFAYRATEVSELAQVADPVGPLNAWHLKDLVSQADVVVPCWGSRQKLPRSLWPVLDDVQLGLAATRRPLRALGFSGPAGDPAHPLFLPYATPLVDLDWNHSL